MLEKNDWRLMNQMEYLYKKRLLCRPYEHYRDGWDHDHCEFCSVKFSIGTGESYCTEDKYHWICMKCFNDFHEVFAWVVV